MTRTLCPGCHRLHHVAEMLWVDGKGWRCATCVEDGRVRASAPPGSTIAPPGIPT
mgnify:CR=1 FL=1